MNEYLHNIHTHSKKETFIYKPLSKYRMGWKIASSKDPSKMLLNSSNKTQNNKNSINNNNLNSLLENSSSNNCSIYSNNQESSTSKKSKSNKKKYNIYEKFPEYFPELTEQGDIDACVPHCISTVYYYNTFKQGNHLNFGISRLFLYYNVRKIYNEMSDDAGSRIIDCIKILKKTGVPPEMLHPYHEKFLYKKPNELSNRLAKYCKLLGFKELKRNEIKNNLLENNPVICGIKIFENFNNKNTVSSGQVILPEKNEVLLGGHSIVIVGYDDKKKNYIFVNSWGKSWGNDGIGYIPYEYLNNVELADEFFILTKITNPIINFFSNEQLYKTNKIIEKIKLKNNFNKSDKSDKSTQLVKILLLSILIIIHNL